MAIDADPASAELVASGGGKAQQENDIGSRKEEAALGPINTAQRVGRHVLAFGLVAVLVLGALVGWLGYRVRQSDREEARMAVFVQAARQAAIDLTTISYTDVDANVARIIGSSTGRFRDDFQQRAPGFVATVRQARSTSQGTVTEAGLESLQGDRGRVLLAVSVRTTTVTDPSPQPRGWRMRIDLQQTTDGAAISNVEFVP